MACPNPFNGSFPRVSHVTVPKGYPRVAHPQNLSTGAFPTATFSQNFLAVPNKPGVPKPVSWSPPQAPSSDVIGEMREAVKSTDWWQLYLDKKTKFRVAADWSADSSRCGLLQTLCAVSGARRVLEIGQCCGVATLAMAEVLPEGGQVCSVEIDPFLADFAKQFWARSPHGGKIHSFIGTAMEYLKGNAPHDGPFDLVVIDADKDGIWEYYCKLKQGLLAPKAIVVVDTTPHKGQPPDRYVRFGAEHKWESNSGQEAIEAALKHFQTEDSVSMASFGGVTVLYPKPAA
ncbi:unnamed protein product [Durusdinium trenchii]|uniref:O-methyltransferase n=1 Tax=Durusdinium trenchii TaxID=1381693 RepID=A0ABP0P9V7_9DINO